MLKNRLTGMRTGGILLAFFAGSSGCGPASVDLPALGIEPAGPAFATRGVVPCVHPMPRKVAFDAPTALGVSAQAAFAEVDASCTAPFKWTGAAEDTEIAVEVVLDRESVLEVTYPASDVCTNKLKVEADVVLSTSDGKLQVEGRGTFAVVLGAGPADQRLDPIMLPLELSIPAEALQRAGFQAVADGPYTLRVGGGGPACAGEIRRQNDATAGVVGSWSANGCPLGETALEADSSPALAVRLEQLAQAWREAHLKAAWDTGNTTELELDVNASAAPICQNHFRVVSVPVDVRYGTSDGVIPVHDALGKVDFSLLSDEPTVRLLVTEQTDCAVQPSPGYCESLSSAKLRLDIQYPNAPSRRLARLVVEGQVRGSSRNATTQHVLTVAGRPYAVECLLKFDCAVDQICDDGFCRAPARTQTRSGCAFDSDCPLGWHCSTGICSAL